MDAAEGLVMAGVGKANDDLLAGRLRARVEIESSIVDADIVRARIVVEHGQR